MQLRVYDFRSEVVSLTNSSKAMTASLSRISMMSANVLGRMTGQIINAFFEHPRLYKRIDPGRKPQVLEPRMNDYLGSHPPSWKMNNY